MNQKQKLIADLIPLLKEKGYSRRKQSWYKENSDLVVVFRIEHSNYSKDEYYIWLGIVIKALNEDEGLRLDCDISYEVPQKTKDGDYVSAETLMNILGLWEEWYGNLPILRRKAVEGKLPIISSAKAKTFLTTVRLG